MSNQVIVEYLTKLLNKPITAQTEIFLSSAQKSRVHDWLTKNQILFNESILEKRFTITELLLDGYMVEGRSQMTIEPIISLPPRTEAGNFLIGIDIQRVDELFPKGLPIDIKVDQELAGIYTLKELSYAQSKINPELTLTGIFCAKEAIQKVTNLTKNLNEIEVLPDEVGRPKSNGYSISISHSGNYAIAVAVKENSPPPTNGGIHAIQQAIVSLPENKFTYFQIRVIDVFLIALLLMVLSFQLNLF